MNLVWDITHYPQGHNQFKHNWRYIFNTTIVTYMIQTIRITCPHYVISFWVGEKTVEFWHDLWRPVANKLPEGMLRILFPFFIVVQHSCSPLFLDHPLILRGRGRKMLPKLRWLIPTNRMHCNIPCGNGDAMNKTWNRVWRCDQGASMSFQLSDIQLQQFLVIHNMYCFSVRTIEGKWWFQGMQVMNHWIDIRI